MEIKAAVAAAVSFFVVLSTAWSVAASERAFLTSGTVRSRALAMGSAYSSLEDDLSSGFYNPAAFRINAARSERRFRLIFNPVGCAVAFSDYARYNLDYREDRSLTSEETALAASMIVKGGVFTTQVFDVGFAYNEPVIQCDAVDLAEKRFFTVEGITREAFHGAFLNLKIAPTVAFGLAGSLYRSRSEGRYKYYRGYSFGVLLDPTNRMKVGFAYHQIPEELSGSRADLENIETGTVTGGVSYYPDSQTTLSMDVRNLNKEDKAASLEIHAGTERIIGDHLALRAGYFRKKGTENDVLSFGAGILPVWAKLHKYRHSTRQDLLSYTIIMEERDTKRILHIVSLFLVY